MNNIIDLNDFDENYNDFNDENGNNEILEQLDVLSDSDDSLDSSLDSIELNIEHFEIKRIKNTKRPFRITYGEHYGTLGFHIIWKDNTESRESILNLIDKEAELVNEHIIDILRDYKETAQHFPHNNRLCIMCYNKAHNGLIMCNHHNNIYNFLNDL